MLVFLGIIFVTYFYSNSDNRCVSENKRRVDKKCEFMKTVIQDEYFVSI